MTHLTLVLPFFLFLAFSSSLLEIYIILVPLNGSLQERMVYLNYTSVQALIQSLYEQSQITRTVAWAVAHLWKKKPIFLTVQLWAKGDDRRSRTQKRMGAQRTDSDRDSSSVP